MAPRALARFARTLSPPTVADDMALRKRRALSMKWIEGGRELVINGRLPLEQGAASSPRSAAPRKPSAHSTRSTTARHSYWQQSAADALVTLTTRSGSGNGSMARRERRATRGRAAT